MIYAIYKWELTFSIHIFFLSQIRLTKVKEKEFAQTLNLQNKLLKGHNFNNIHIFFSIKQAELPITMYIIYIYKYLYIMIMNV